jgi:hypothetical protein
MKALIFFSVLVFASCGRYEVPGASGVGTSRSTNPLVVDPSDVNKICQALSQKSPNSLISTPVNFSVASKGCNDEKIGAPSNIATTIQNTINGYKFLNSIGIVPFFGDIETIDKGTMSPICAQLAAGTLASPIANGNEFIYFNTTSVSPANCTAGTNEICIEVSRASGTGNGQAIEHTKEWIRFNLDNTQGRGGFFTLKTQETSSGCEVGKSSINTTTIR